jgi:hypothetical protein
MSNVGRGAKGNVYTGKLGLPPSFLPLGTGSGLTDNGLLIANGDNPFTTTIAGTNGQVVIASTGDEPDFATITSSGGTISFTPGPNSLNMEAGATVPTTITADTGSAVPAANNLNILGGPGVTTSGSGSTLTINSVVFTNTTATTLAVDNGYFATAAGTYNMPATAAQGEVIEIVVDVAGVVVLDCPALNFIRIGNTLTSSGGTATSSGLAGDSLKLRYRLSSLTWEAISVIGNWITA